VLTDALKQQLKGEVRKLQIVPKKDAVIKLSEEEFTSVALIAQKYALKIQNSSERMF